MKLEKYFLRSSESDKYLIPASIIGEFDELNEKLVSLDDDTDEFYDACQKMDENFGIYVVEGWLSDIPLFLEKAPYDYLP